MLDTYSYEQSIYACATDLRATDLHQVWMRCIDFSNNSRLLVGGRNVAEAASSATFTFPNIHREYSAAAARAAVYTEVSFENKNLQTQTRKAKSETQDKDRIIVCSGFNANAWAPNKHNIQCMCCRLLLGPISSVTAC